MRQELARLSKNTLIYGVGGLVNRFIAFLFLPVFTAYLSPADYGISAILGLVTFIATSVFSLGLGAGIGPCYFEGNQQEQKDTTIWTAFALLMLSAACVVAGGLLFARQLSILAFGTPDHAFLMQLTVAMAALNILAIPLTLRLQFEEQASTFVRLTIGSSLASIALCLLLVVILGRGVRGLVEAGLIGQAVGLLLLLFLTVPSLAFRLSRSVAAELLRLSLPLVPGFAFVFILQHGNKYILQWMRGLDEVGIYSIGFNIGFVMNLFVSAFQTAWYPYFMSFLNRQEEARRLFGRIFTYYVLGSGALTLVFFVLARPVVALMTPPAFHEAYKVVGLSASAQLLIGVFGLLLPGIYFAREVKYLSVIQGMAAAISVGLSIVMIRAAGMLGAAMALALGMLILAGLQHLWSRYRRYLDVQFEWPRLRRFAVIFVLYTLATLWDPGWPPLGLVLFLGILTCLLPVWLYVLLSPAERDAVRAVCLVWASSLPHRRSSRA